MFGCAGLFFFVEFLLSVEIDKEVYKSCVIFEGKRLFLTDMFMSGRFQKQSLIIFTGFKNIISDVCTVPVCGCFLSTGSNLLIYYKQ